MTKITHKSRKLSALLMVGASGLALATPVQANDYLFTSEDKPLVTGERVKQRETLTQVRLTGGGTASFTDQAEYQINQDGSVELYNGTVTVASAPTAPVIVRMPEGLEGRVAGRGSAANFRVRKNGDASGHALTGSMRVGRAGRLRSYEPGAMWAANAGAGPRRVVANEAQTAPDAAPAEKQVVAIGGDAGPVAAALNGIPVTLGDALAAAGASSDILSAARRVEVAVGNPNLDRFPSGDLAALIARAAEIEGAFGGSPFPQAQADIIRAYLRFLAGNGGPAAGSQFLASFSAFSLDYLDLIRVGGVPSGFAAAGLADINAYLAFIDRTGALAQLGAQDRVLAEAYLVFLRDGGNPDLFAASFTDLTDAYFAFVRGGGAPDAFDGASQAVLAQTIAFLSESGLIQQLSAADQALVAAFLANGGLAFTGQFQAALNDYFAFLAAGNLPSAYEPVDQASLRQFLETLSNTGLLNTVLGDQAQFYADYLAFLRAGGDVDAFAGLPVNIFTDYASQLAAYRAFLDAGNLPSAFTGTDPAQLQAFIAELQAAGALARFTGADADFFAAFAAFVNGGGAFDAFAGLNANIFAGYAVELQAYFAFLEAGGVPSTYEPLSQEVIAQYLAELQAAGAKARFLPELADFYAAYFAFISDGGNPDNFAGLPVPPDFGAFAAALNAYADFLANGGFPADFADTDLTVLASFIEALSDAGELDARLGDNADLLSAYFAFLANGGAPNAFTGLPIYAQYVADLNTYFAFLAAGGFPQDYEPLDQATLNAFLAALADLQGGLAGFEDLDAFFIDYAVFVLGGGDPTAFAGLPIYAQYVADLNAYFAFLAAGGVPSEYAVLSQDIINAYLAALANAQGGLAGFDALETFFIDYFAFVQGGGDVDQFAGLPGNMGGGGNGGGMGGGQRPDFAGGFTATENLNIYATTSDAIQSRIGQTGSVDDTGAFTSPFFDLGTASLVDVGGDAAAVIGRFTDGTINTVPGGLQTLPENGGLAYAVVAPYTGTIPTSGTINYEVLSATQPVYYDGFSAPGTFEADLAFTFGSQISYRMSGQINIGTESYQIGSGADFRDTRVADFEALNFFNAARIELRPNFFGSGRACVSGDCDLLFVGGLAGDSDANRVAFTYRSVDNFVTQTPQTSEVLGAVIFGAEGTLDANGGVVDGGGGTGGGTPIVLSDRRGVIGYPGVGFSSIGRGEFELDGNGVPTRYSAGTSINGTVVTPGPATESGAVDETISWTRWEEGDITATFGRRTETRRLANVHVITGAPATNIPTMGVVDFELIGATNPSDGNGLFGATGTFDGDLAIDFATQRVGIDFDITADIYGWNLRTDGGADDPSNGGLQFVNSAADFQGAPTVTALTDASCLVQCSALVAGNLNGDGVSHVGVGFFVTDQITLNGSPALINTQGVAAFANAGVRSGDGGGSTGGNSGGDTLIASDFTGTLENQFTFVGNSGARGTGDAFYENGELVGFEAPAPFVSVADASGATISDAGANADMAWARWSDGPIRFNGGVEQTPATFSYHTVSGNPTESIPTTGTVNYDLIATTPLTVDGSTQQGTLTGDLAILFGSAPVVGFDVTAQLGERSWSASTPGGAANPNQSTLPVEPDSTFRFNANFNNLTTTNALVGAGGACSDICSMRIDGRLFGENGNSASMFIDISDRENGVTTNLQGLMLFQAATAGATGADTGRTTASIAPSVVPATMTGGDWARWGGTGSASAQGSNPGMSRPQEIGLLPPGANAAEGRATSPAVSREAAIRQVEAIMGGSITFARPGSAGAAE